jgi:membrane-bound metal-dependent hydrolase YbcI (DUF457 family)
MLFITHLITGVILGAISGNYLWVILGSMLVDIDHVYVFLRHRIYNPLHMVRLGCDSRDVIKGQRTVAHSLLGWAIVSGAIYLFDATVGFYFGVGYLAHLLLDAFDKAELQLFYPLSWHIRGPINYNSRSEHVLLAVLVVLILLL